jgi:hypothetical protein
MNPSQEILDRKLIELETLVDVSEHEFESQLNQLENKDVNDPPCQEWIYEVLAFSFCENYSNQNVGWNTYFGPTAVFPSEDGRWIEYPSIQKVDQDAIAYWNMRLGKTQNPIMKARYAGLIWDLSEKTTAQKPQYSVAIEYCKSLLKIAKERLHKYDTKTIDKLRRAMEISVSIGNKLLIEESKNAILDYEDFIAEDSKPGLWGSPIQI